jgi:hypothetical protein
MLVRATVHTTTRVKSKKDSVWVYPGNGASPGQGQAHGPKLKEIFLRHLAASMHMAKVRLAHTLPSLEQRAHL